MNYKNLPPLPNYFQLFKDIYKLYEKLKVLDNQHNECEPVQKKLKSNDSLDPKTDIKREIERLNNQMIEKLGRSKDKAFLFEVNQVSLSPFLCP